MLSNDTKKVNIALIYGGRFRDSKLNVPILPFHIKRDDGWSESCSSLRVQGDKPCGAPRAEAETCLDKITAILSGDKNDLNNEGPIG